MNTINIKESKNIKLMNRIDKKYVIDFNQFCLLSDYIVNNYYIVVDDSNKFLLSYKSIYFDTANLDMYNDHKLNVENRQKLRIREYENGDQFLEIKTKSDNKTKKIRVNLDLYNIDHYMCWINDNLNYAYSAITPVLEINFKRLTLINKEKNSRITIDFGISFKNYNTNINKKIKEIVIEVKKSDESYITSFEKKLSSLNIEESKFSKYYIGINSTLKK